MSLVAEVRSNLLHAMECFTRAKNESETRQMPGLEITNAAVRSPVFNASFLTEPVGGDPVELDRRASMAKVYYDARGLDWSLWLFDELLEPSLRKSAKSVLAARGLTAVTECPGMTAEEVVPTRRRLPDLEFRRVGDLSTRLAFCHITSVCFRIPFSTSVEIYNSPATWETGFKAHIGYLDGEPVATAATVDAAGVIGLYSVATLPDYQKRGIGECITRYVLEEARNNGRGKPMVLQSTRHGGGIYRYIGFRPVSRIRIFVAQQT